MQPSCSPLTSRDWLHVASSCFCLPVLGCQWLPMEVLACLGLPTGDRHLCCVCACVLHMQLLHRNSSWSAEFLHGFEVARFQRLQADSCGSLLDAQNRSCTCLLEGLLRARRAQLAQAGQCPSLLADAAPAGTLREHLHLVPCQVTTRRQLQNLKLCSLCCAGLPGSSEA